MILIGIAGLARSGKDTAAAYLAKELGLYQYAFAEPLKTMLKSVFGDHFHLGDRSGICPEAGVSYRSLMQTLGTEWGRQQVNPDLWVNLVDRYWKHLNEAVKRGHIYEAAEIPVPKGMILSDVRFDSEAKWIKDNGGWVFRVHREGVESVGQHASEAGVSHAFVDREIDNNSSLEWLHREIEYACHYLGIN